MTITAKHNRVAVGLKFGDWSVVYYEPLEPIDLTTPYYAPEIGLYSHSKDEPRPNEPMPGQVAWEPLLGAGHAESGVKKERDRLQKMLLCDSWRYTVAEDPAHIETIRTQLQETTKQRVLLGQLDQARKTRSINIKRRRQRRERRRQRTIELGLPAESVEQDDDEENSGLGSGGEGEGDEDNERGSMPPPQPPRRYGPNGTPSGPRASRPPRNWTREMSSIVEDDDDVVETVRSGSNAAASRSRGPASVRASGSKRRRNEGSETHRSRGRTESSAGMLVRSDSYQSQRLSSADDNGRHDGPLVPGVNGDFDNEEDAVSEAIRQSVIPEERMNTLNFENGLATALRNSMAPASPSRQSRPL
jgi:hypothetical protein